MINKNSNVTERIVNKSDENREYPTKVPVYVNLGDGHGIGVVIGRVNESNSSRHKYSYVCNNGYVQTGFEEDSIQELFDTLYKRFPSLKILDVEIKATYK